MHIDRVAQCGLAIDDRGRATIMRALNTLQNNPHAVGYMEEGLVYGCAALNGLGCYDQVRAVYARFGSTVRESAHSVLACVRLGHVQGALGALAALARSRKEGWGAINPLTVQVIAEVCRLTGRAGSPADVPVLYRTLVSIHSPLITLSNMMNSVLAGVCDRIDTAASRLGPLQHTKPHTVLQYVVPMAQAVLGYLGDDVAADMIFELLHCALRAEHVCVPLTVALVWAMQQCPCMSVQELFRPVPLPIVPDQPTAPTPHHANAHASTEGEAAVWVSATRPDGVQSEPSADKPDQAAGGSLETTHTRRSESHMDVACCGGERTCAARNRPLCREKGQWGGSTPPTLHHRCPFSALLCSLQRASHAERDVGARALSHHLAHTTQ